MRRRYLVAWLEAVWPAMPGAVEPEHFDDPAMHVYRAACVASTRALRWSLVEMIFGIIGFVSVVVSARLSVLVLLVLLVFVIAEVMRLRWACASSALAAAAREAGDARLRLLAAQREQRRRGLVALEGEPK